MGYLDRLNPKKHPVSGALTGMALYGAASYGFGYAKTRWHNKAQVMGVPVDILAGVVLKGAALAGMFMGKAEGLVPHLDTLGNAGIGAFLHTYGAAHGAAASGMRRLLIPASDVQKAKAALPNATVLGEIPKAPPGDFLSTAELQAMARS